MKGDSARKIGCFARFWRGGVVKWLENKDRVGERGNRVEDEESEGKRNGKIIARLSAKTGGAVCKRRNFPISEIGGPKSKPLKRVRVGTAWGRKASRPSKTRFAMTGEGRSKAGRADFTPAWHISTK